MESILTSVKKMLGLPEEYEYFDMDIIMHINTVLMTLSQLGVGPSNGLVIKGKEETWDLLFTDLSNTEGIKSYVFLKVRLLFDPPASSTVMEAIKSNISELEWRLNVTADTYTEEPTNEQ